MIGLLILLHLVSTSDAEAYRRQDDGWDGLLTIVLFPVFIVLFMPYLVWSAARENGGSRLEAGSSVAMALATVGLVGLLAGWWWSVPMVLAIGTFAMLHVGIRAYRDKKREESFNVD